jgi:hypothetical protein
MAYVKKTAGQGTILNLQIENVKSARIHIALLALIILVSARNVKKVFIFYWMNVMILAHILIGLNTKKGYTVRKAVLLVTIRMFKDGEPAMLATLTAKIVWDLPPKIVLIVEKIFTTFLENV